MPRVPLKLPQRHQDALHPLNHDMVKSGKELGSSETHTSTEGGKPSSGIRLSPTPSNSCLQSSHLALWSSQGNPVSCSNREQRDAALMNS